MQTSTIKTSSYSESGGKRLKRLKEEGMKEGKEEKERNRFSEEKQSIRVSVPLHYSYMDVQLIIGGNKTAIEEDQFATTCLAAIAPVFGRAIGTNGKEIVHDTDNQHNYGVFTILKYDEEKGQAILQIQKDKIKQVWGSLTLCSLTPSSAPCKFDVKKVSPFLSYLFHGSRQWEQSL